MTHTKRSPDYYGAQRIAKLEALNAELLEALELARHIIGGDAEDQTLATIDTAIARARGES